ncbi:DUF1934 domain-containing protein [Pseudalkalibacillus caeni]|uniref:DUF1934 domain-containing protein n=1 Tax=Exobacillus caeni TaxID=2574798 RepID=A0A5R9F107_9BACL|nr:DUF1934 domain-containing protein [Pseudalkalibacillus caeni]TLS36681.1 DUF1934 domain-containing protein [Pseudalkalibacillus caeni]
MQSEVQVNLELDTVIGHGRDKEKTNLKTSGSVFQKSNATYIKYDEHLEAGKVSNVVKITGTQVTVIRRGAVSMRQTFEQGKTTESVYQSPFGALQMEAKTTQVSFEWDEQNRSGKLSLDYQLSLQQEQPRHHQMTFTLKGVSV